MLVMNPGKQIKCDQHILETANITYKKSKLVAVTTLKCSHDTAIPSS